LNHLYCRQNFHIFLCKISPVHQMVYIKGMFVLITISSCFITNKDKCCKSLECFHSFRIFSFTGTLICVGFNTFFQLIRFSCLRSFIHSVRQKLYGTLAIIINNHLCCKSCLPSQRNVEILSVSKRHFILSG
jgi:hypothetical protein